MNQVTVEPVDHRRALSYVDNNVCFESTKLF